MTNGSRQASQARGLARGHALGCMAHPTERAEGRLALGALWGAIGAVSSTSRSRALALVRMARALVRLGRVGSLVGSLLVLAGCASGGGFELPSLSSLNPFAESEERLPGERLPVLEHRETLTSELEPAKAPITLPPPRPNDAWTQPGGVPSNAPGHLALQAALKTAWRADAGAGSSSYGRLTVSPIVYDGRIYTLDTQSNVSAFSATSGKRLWRVSLVPDYEDKREGFGGGLAAEGGRVIAATGYGTVVALDARSGKKLWEKALGVPVRASPTAAEGKVFVTTIEGRFYCLSAADGSELWSFRGLPQKGSLLTNVSPAVAKGLVIVPYPSGDVVALDAASGRALWSDSLARTGALAAFGALNDPARPVIAGGAVYAVGHGGRMIASRAKSGERLWSQSVRANQTPWVAGDAVYVVDVNGRLMALARESGKLRWMTKLPAAKTWSGPVLAGGRLWLASASGQLVGVDAATGRVVIKRDLGQPIYIAPVVAGGRMYILTDKAKLIALR